MLSTLCSMSGLIGVLAAANGETWITVLAATVAAASVIINAIINAKSRKTEIAATQAKDEGEAAERMVDKLLTRVDVLESQNGEQAKEMARQSEQIATLRESLAVALARIESLTKENDRLQREHEEIRKKAG